MRLTALLALGVTVACGDAAPRAEAAAYRSQIPDPAAAVAARQDRRAAARDSLLALRHSAIVEAANQTAPAVVSVNVLRRQRRRPRSALEYFFTPRGAERMVEGFGSGFILTPDGLVITNQHVTAGADEIVVTTRDGTDYEARLVGEDPLTDIAVLRIDAQGLPVAPIGGSEDLMIGEWVVAIGNPYAYLLGNTEPSVTAGVVSAVGRNLLPSSDEGTFYVGMIQTDAPINPGNSGGPLVNALGEVVGVNSSIFSESGGSVGIGFAIPIERALRVARELERYGSVRRAWVGLDVAGGERLREWKRSGGLQVTDVAGGSPADEAGIAPSDILLAANGEPLRTFLDWEAVKLDIGPGDQLTVRYRRDGGIRTTTLRVEELPTSRAERIAVLGDLELITVTPAVRQERGLRSEAGALIYRIGARTRQATGLQENDVIIAINRRRIHGADEAQEAFRGAAGGGPIRVFFERGGALGYTDFYVR